MSAASHSPMPTPIKTGAQLQAAINGASKVFVWTEFVCHGSLGADHQEAGTTGILARMAAWRVDEFNRWRGRIFRQIGVVSPRSRCAETIRVAGQVLREPHLYWTCGPNSRSMRGFEAQSAPPSAAASGFRRRARRDETAGGLHPTVRGVDRCGRDIVKPESIGQPAGVLEGFKCVALCVRG